MMCSAWPMLGSLDRSDASQILRAGRPKTVRYCEATCVSGNCSARVPTGKPANDVGTPSTCEVASSKTSAGKRRITYFE